MVAVQTLNPAILAVHDDDNARGSVLAYLLVMLGLQGTTAWSALSYQRFRARMRAIEWRVHVNGIRGKSTVTRYIAAIFREAGYHTFGKTTGSAARLLLPDGKDGDVRRKGFANVNEQVRILSDFSRQNAQAAVMECMAINPVYAQWLEERVMQSHIGVITNVRYDHAEYLGETLPQIAQSLARSIPRFGVVITAETNGELVQILRARADERNSLLIAAEAEQVAAEDLHGFSHFAVPDNVAIGFCLADLLGLSRSRALRAMQAAASDPGAFQTQRFRIGDRNLVWANLFAVNDRESFVALSQILIANHPGYQTALILNNRLDRPTRVRLFAELAVAIGYQQIISFGDYEEEVNAILAEHKRVALNLGQSTRHRDASGQQLLQAMLESSASDGNILLIGTVNIHTHQAERLLEYLQELDDHQHT